MSQEWQEPNQAPSKHEPRWSLSDHFTMAQLLRNESNVITTSCGCPCCNFSKHRDIERSEAHNGLDESHLVRSFTAPNKNVSKIPQPCFPPFDPFSPFQTNKHARCFTNSSLRNCATELFRWSRSGHVIVTASILFRLDRFLSMKRNCFVPSFGQSY